MLEDLASECLEVALIPAPVQCHCTHSVRTVFQANPGWYRKLCATHQRHRRSRADRFVDPAFKRADVLRTLRLLLSSGSRSWLAGSLLAVATRIHREQLADLASLQADLALELGACFPWDLPADAAAMGVAI